ncbi:MAG: FecR domain-containing protein [Flavobacteriaceae bacterium]|jgi:ferric-dicitrate binding protein FerR (iron transport regulator)|nr:FecR domain-containing protein [Flavobacteriaceae bacterium]
MIKQFKRILSKYAEGDNTKEEESLVNQYFDKMQVGGIQPIEVNETIGERIKKKIYHEIKPTNKIPFAIYYKIAAVVAIVLSLSYFLIPSSKEVEYIEQFAAKGQQLQFYLSDSTYVHLNSNSKLIYPKRFDGTSREVQLIGEAFFEVKHTSTHTPFIVKSTRLYTEVLGTKFNVNDSPNETVQVSVYEGKVRVEEQQTKQRIVLVKDEQVTWTEESNSLQKVTLQAEQFNQWYKGEVKFNQMGIQEVITVLNRRFNIHLQLASSNLPKATISGDFTSDKIEDILQSLQFIYGIRYEKQNEGKIIVHLK